MAMDEKTGQDGPGRRSLRKRKWKRKSENEVVMVRFFSFRVGAGACAIDYRLSIEADSDIDRYFGGDRPANEGDKARSRMHMRGSNNDKVNHDEGSVA